MDMLEDLTYPLPMIPAVQDHKYFRMDLNLDV